MSALRGRRRVTDDRHATVGDGVTMQEEHAQQLNNETRKSHRRRLYEMMEFWLWNYPEYFEVGTSILTEEEIQNEMLFYHPEVRNFNGRDVVYEGLNVDMVLAFFSSKKHKPNGKMCSNENMRKHHDAITFGASAVGHLLPSAYHSKMDKFQNSFKKVALNVKLMPCVD